MDVDRLVRLFVELADTMVEDYDVLDLFNTLTSGCVELLDARAVGLAVGAAADDLHLVATSDHGRVPVHVLQLQAEQGPAVDCYRSGQPVEASLTECIDRWPAFAPAALAEGYGTVTALPMRLRGQVIGALTLLGSADAPPVKSQDLVVAQSLADAATIAILQDRQAKARELVTEQLEGALSSRILIEQAKGMLSASLGIGPDEAFTRLREHARDTRRRLTDVAREAIDGDGREFGRAGHQGARDRDRSS